MDLSAIGFRTFFGSTFLGPVASTGRFKLAPLSTSNLPLTGRLVPQTTTSGLADVSTVFNNFVHGKDSNVAVQGDSAGPSDVTWLNNAIKKLQIATVLPNQGVLTIIKAITLDEMTLMFTPGTAYSPSASSHTATAAFTLPFALPIDITGLEQNITTGYKGTDFAQLQVPMGSVTTDVQNRIIHLTFSKVPFGVFSGREGVFQQFLADTTTSQSETFRLSGNANAVASTAVGTITLSGVAFSVDTTIAGLQGLSTRPAVISNLDVNRGYPDYLLIKVTTTLYNPSNLTIGTGDVSFGLQYASQTIGSAVVNGMTIVPGSANYSTDVHYSPQGDAATGAGRTMLQNFLQGIVSPAKIQGSHDTTAVNSLKLAMSEIALQADIPALHQRLITGTTIVFSPDISQTGIAQATTDLNNPFTASLNILALAAHVYYHGLNIGNIDRFDTSSQPIHAGGHSSITTPTLPLKFNLDPLVIIQMLSTASQEAGVDIGPLKQMFQLVVQNPTYHPNITATVANGDSGCHSGTQFDVNGAILKSLAGLKVDLAVDTTLKLDDYQTDLSFNQTNVPAHTDVTALYLITVVAPPVVQKLVDGAALVFSESDISNITEQGFSLSLKGAMTGTGPLDALIEFPEPVVVNWQGADIATLVLPGVCAAANVGVPDYKTNTQLTITNIEAFTQFSIYMLHNESFEWKISTTAVRVTALGIKFDGVTLSKTITLKAFNGLPGVTISNFQLPSDDPAGGIHIETDSSIPSPAQLGIALGSVTFQSYFRSTLVGPLSASSMTLAPQATTKTHLAGHIVPQSGDDLKNIGTLFTNFLQGKNQTLTVKGDSVNPGNGVVSWLSTAFKTIELQVVLPGQKFDIIKGIAIGDLSTLITEQSQAYNPPTSSSHTVAQYANPFGFSLQVIRASESIKILSHGVDVASLDIPALDVTGPPSTGNTVDMVLHFSNVPLVSLNNAAFEAFFAAATLTGHVDFTLGGSADVIARTSIGDVPIAAIPFNVPSSLNGINDFGGNVGLTDVKITGSGGSGGNQFILGVLNSHLKNPSNISLGMNDVSLGVSYQGTYIGRATISNFDLKPGDNSIASEFHYVPNDTNNTIAQSFLTKYLTSGDNIPLTIHGDAQSTSYGSLSQAMQGVSLQGSLTGLNANPILTHVNAYITAGSLFSSEINVDFDVKNPLDVDLQITYVQSDSGVNGDTYAQFAQSFSNFIVPAGGTANSGKFDHVRLTKGALGSLPIIPLGRLDVNSAITLTVGIGGYNIPSLQLVSSNTPTSYHVNLF